MSSEKRMLAALALSFVLIGAYPAIIDAIYPEAKAKRIAAERAAEAPKTAVTESAPVASGATVAVPAMTAPDADVFHPDRDLVFKNGQLSLLFNQNGGALRQVAFPAYPDPLSKKPLKIFELQKPGGAPLSLSLSAPSLSSAEAWPAFSLARSESGVTGSAQSFDGTLGIQKSVAFNPSGYDGKMTLTFENRSGAPLSFRYQLGAGESFPTRDAIDGQYIETNFYVKLDAERRALKHVKESKAGKSVESQGPLEWIATKDRLFSVIMKPLSAGDFTGVVNGLGDNRFRATLVSPPVSLAPGQVLTQEFQLYVGPTDIQHLDPLGLGGIVNFGKFDIIAKLLVGGIELFHNVFKNYGLAIIALTFAINVLLFPFTRASYMSMKRMQLVQPQMAKLKEQNKKNPEKLQKEMMELYKKHKVNPFGGCLPMLLQMPIFYALFVAFCKLTSLTNARFLWIQDLSTPDKIALPFSLPFVGQSIHALPLILVAVSIVQQRFTQVKLEGQDPAMEAQQKMMAFMMPFLFGLIFYTMPSGYVLYFLVNTFFMTLLQLRLKNMTLES